MDTEQKLLLLRAATSHPFSTKSNLFQTLTAQFPTLSGSDIEEFLVGMVDFDSILQWQVTEQTEQTTEHAIEQVSEHVHEFNVETSFSESKPSTPAPFPFDPPKPTPSPPLVVPARTPSGRTLRSNSTVNTSEPRRLRSNK